MMHGLGRALLALLVMFTMSSHAAPPRKAPPSWAELSAQQQQILAPLKTDWDTLDPDGRRKWLGIAKRYPNMKPEAQERVQRRMQAWTQLSPEERRQARETYKRIAKVPPERRQALQEQWAEYQALPPEERERLAPPEAPKTKRRTRSNENTSPAGR